MNRRRSGFTLTELLIVIGILLILSTISLAVYNTGRSSDRIRSAARVGQSALLGAKDRAMHAKTFRGVRLIRDANGPTFSATNLYPCLVTGFVFTQPIQHDPYPTGSISLERVDLLDSMGNPGQDGNPDSADILIVRGISLGNQNAVDWSNVYGFFGSVGQIRIPAGSGQWYNFTVATSGYYAIGPNNQCLILQTPYSNTGSAAAGVVAFPFSGNSPAPIAGCEIQFGNEVLPFHAPMSLPSGVVIDLRWSSPNIQYLAGGNIANTGGSTAGPNIDISFSPRGSIAGATGGLGAIYFCLRDLEDAVAPSSVVAGNPRDPSDAACKGECLILAVNPATGLVQTFPADLTDAYNNSTGASGGDGYVDNIFSFAQQGKAAGR